MRDDLAEILFLSFLQKALVSSSGMGRDVHCLMLSIHHFLCRPRRCHGVLKDGFGEAVVACDLHGSDLSRSILQDTVDSVLACKKLELSKTVSYQRVHYISILPKRTHCINAVLCIFDLCTRRKMSKQDEVPLMGFGKLHQQRSLDSLVLAHPNRHWSCLGR